MSEPMDRQRGMPARHTSAPSPSFPERRAMINCSIVISTVSVPPRSTYQRGLSVAAGCAGDDGRRAGDDGREGGRDGRGRLTAELSTRVAAEPSSTYRLAAEARPPTA